MFGRVIALFKNELLGVHVRAVENDGSQKIGGHVANGAVRNCNHCVIEDILAVLNAEFLNRFVVDLEGIILEENIGNRQQESQIR